MTKQASPTNTTQAQPQPFTDTTPTNKLTNKQKIFVKEILDNPKQSATQAALKAYNVNSNGAARQIASENLTKPNIVSALAASNDVFESVIKGTAEDWGKSDKPREREIALDAAKFAHDKIHGKAKQVSEVVSTGITLNIDLTSSLAE